MRRGSLTPEQVREARLSLESHAEVARLLGVSQDVVEKARTGATYGELSEDEKRALDLRRNNKAAPAIMDHPLMQFSIGHIPFGYRSSMFDPVDFAESLDAVNECKHGRLAGDRTVPCGCWPSEPIPFPQIVVDMEKAA